jgi:hypothetical protein
VSIFLLQVQIIEGPQLKEVVKDIATFFKENESETVILKFSHFQDFSDSAYLQMTEMISKYLDEWMLKEIPDGFDRLAEVTMNNYVGTILVVIDEDWAIDRAIPGFWVYRDWDSENPHVADLTVFDEYADTTKFEEMKEDQLAKLNDFKGICAHDSKVPCDLFLLSWTLTPWTNVASTSKDANRELGAVASYLQPNSKGFYPNLIYLDYLEKARPTFNARNLILRYT